MTIPKTAIVTDLNWSNEGITMKNSTEQLLTLSTCRDQYDFHSVWCFQSCLLKSAQNTDTTWESYKIPPRNKRAGTLLYNVAGFENQNCLILEKS